MEVFAANLGGQGCDCIVHSAHSSRLALAAACENEIGGDDRSRAVDLKPRGHGWTLAQAAACPASVASLTSTRRPFFTS